MNNQSFYGSVGTGDPKMPGTDPALQQAQEQGGVIGDMLFRGKAEAGPPADLSQGQLLQVSSIAWVIFSVVCLLFGFCYHDSPTEIWTMLTLGAVVLLMIMYQSWKKYEESSMMRVSLIVSSWLLLSIVMGTLVGLFAYDCCIGDYWQHQRLESRANVLPSEPAAAYGNAGGIIFADQARVDPSKSVGYKDGASFCVAPVSSDAPMDVVQFWAAGVDCCGARGSFVCDDAWNPKAHAAVVIKNGSFSVFHQDLYGQYLKAVKLAEVTYSIASAKDPIFVRWVSNPDQVELNIWTAGVGVLLACVIIAALVCVLQAVSINLLLRTRRSPTTVTEARVPTMVRQEAPPPVRATAWQGTTPPGQGTSV